MDSYIPVIIALVAGPAVAFITARMSRPKVRADATQTLTDISLSLVEPQKKRIDDLQQKITKLEKKIRELERENHALHTWAQLLFSQVVEAGQEPLPFKAVQLLGGEDEDG